MCEHKRASQICSEESHNAKGVCSADLWSLLAVENATFPLYDVSATKFWHVLVMFIMSRLSTHSYNLQLPHMTFKWISAMRLKCWHQWNEENKNYDLCFKIRKWFANWLKGRLANLWNQTIHKGNYCNWNCNKWVSKVRKWLVFINYWEGFYANTWNTWVQTGHSYVLSFSRWNHVTSCSSSVSIASI